MPLWLARAALLFNAVALAPYASHLLSIGNKLSLSPQDYMVAQRAYDGWAWTSLLLLIVLMLDIAVAWRLRGTRGFKAAATALALLLVSLGLFFAFTYPTNVATENWTRIPENFEILRLEWEWSHATNAAVMFASFVCVVAALVPDPAQKAATERHR